jgi:hypothetical protein
MHGFHFFTREKAITSRWTDPSHGGINLGFPQAWSYGEIFRSIGNFVKQGRIRFATAHYVEFY